MIVEYVIDVDAARAEILSAPFISHYANGRLQELVDLLTSITEDVRMTAEDLIVTLAITAQCCVAVTEQALVHVHAEAEEFDKDG